MVVVYFLAFLRLNPIAASSSSLNLLVPFCNTSNGRSATGGPCLLHPEAKQSGES